MTADRGRRDTALGHDMVKLFSLSEGLTGRGAYEKRHSFRQGGVGALYFGGC